MSGVLDEGAVRLDTVVRRAGREVGEVRREGLVERAKEVDWAGGTCHVLAQGDKKADPLTFFYHLASIAKGRRKGKRSTRALRRSSESRATSTTASATVSSFRRGTRGTSSSTTPKMIRSCFGTCSTRHALVVLTANRTTPRSPTPSPNRCRSREPAFRNSRKSLFLINPRAFLPFDTKAVLPLGYR